LFSGKCRGTISLHTSLFLTVVGTTVAATAKGVLLDTLRAECVEVVAAVADNQQPAFAVDREMDA
jgi:hypothetical protein